MERYKLDEGLSLHVDKKDKRKSVVSQRWRCWACRSLGKSVTYIAKWKENAIENVVFLFAKNLPHLCLLNIERSKSLHNESEADNKACSKANTVIESLETDKHDSPIKERKFFSGKLFKKFK